MLAEGNLAGILCQKEGAPGLYVQMGFNVCGGLGRLGVSCGAQRREAAAGRPHRDCPTRIAPTVRVSTFNGPGMDPSPSSQLPTLDISMTRLSLLPLHDVLPRPKHPTRSGDGG